MNTTLNIIVACSMSLLMTACEPSHDLPSNDARVQHLEKNYPQLKNLRDQIVFQIKTGKTSIAHLEQVRRSFGQESSRKLVDAKIQAIQQQQQQLIVQLNRIDAETERGIALQEFNVIDGGGERRQEIQDLTQESMQRLATAARINGDVDVTYNGHETIIPTQPVKFTLESCVFLDELPPINLGKLRQVFSEHPELFDVQTRQGTRFITMIRNLKQHNPQVLARHDWIDTTVKACAF